MNGIDWTKIEQNELEAFERRVALVETVLDESIDESQRYQVRRAYCQEHGVSERTIRNYIRRYREEGQHGLLFYHRSAPPSEVVESYWRIIYRIENDSVIILAVIDGRRNVDDILIRKLKRKFA